MDTRSRKRQRSETSAISDAAANVILAASDNDPIIRDKTYYREDGDCVILVGKVLFKIHRFLLERDASAFSNMFSLPQENSNNQTNIDENPLVLYDDVDDFRALCWIMYALPTEYSQQHKLATANMQKLVSLYLVSQKYHFEAHEIFARDLLRKHCLSLVDKPSSKFNYFRICPESRLQTLLRIAVLTEQTPTKLDSFPSILQNLWNDRITQSKGSISFALEAGEELGLRRFTAELYYLELTRMRPVLAEGSIAYVHPVNDLATHQKLVLYQGSWSLRQYWSKTRKTSIQKKFECAEDDSHDCHFTWQSAWKKHCTTEWGSRTFDPVKELTSIRNGLKCQSEDSDDKGDFYFPCAMKAIDAMKTELKNSFADHFLGPLPVSISASESSL